MASALCMIGGPRDPWVERNFTAIHRATIPRKELFTVVVQEVDDDSLNDELVPSSSHTTTPGTPPPCIIGWTARVVSYHLRQKSTGEQFIMYRVEVENQRGIKVLYRRYSDFAEMDSELPLLARMHLHLPKKRLFGDRLEKEHVEKRATGLDTYLQALLAYQPYTQLPIVRCFLTDDWLARHKVKQYVHFQEEYGIATARKHRPAFRLPNKKGLAPVVNEPRPRSRSADTELKASPGVRVTELKQTPRAELKVLTTESFPGAEGVSVPLSDAAKEKANDASKGKKKKPLLPPRHPHLEEIRAEMAELEQIRSYGVKTGTPAQGRGPYLMPRAPKTLPVTQTQAQLQPAVLRRLSSMSLEGVMLPSMAVGQFL
eukprot:comp25405_c0_seq1/m.46994 comp25405_c0_seq1/g.46994  ORF comp25405_c0_seq1/g.46994 comp25405_c0_seq1/m.46994 type:complete len:372 (-) comp25405_c0_seq1:564-1679(-)